MIAAMTADVGIVRIQDTRIFPSMDHWTCLQPSDASATAVTAPIWQCVVETGCSWIVACAERRRHVDAIAAEEPASPSPAGARVGATTANHATCSVRHSRRLSASQRLKSPRADLTKTLRVP